MKPEEFRAIRKKFGLSEADWMYALGYAGNQNTMHLNCSRYENGTKEIPLYLARYVWLLDVSQGRWPGPTKMPVWPEFPDYHLDEEKAS